MINRSKTPLQDYERWHAAYNKTLVPQDDLRLMPWHKTVLSLLGEQARGKKILEIGCGNGDFSNYLALAYNADILGVDFSGQSIEIAEQKKEQFGARSSRFLVADAQNLPFQQGTFDLVISCECLEHVPDPQKMLSEAYRVLRQGGKILLTTENYSNAYAYYIPYLKWRGKQFDSGSSVQPVEHFFVFWNVIKKFRRAGFRKVKTHSNEYVMLLLPSCSPATFTIKNTKSPLLRFLLKPFGRRFTYVAEK